MKRIARFEKVSEAQFIQGWQKCFPQDSAQQAAAYYGLIQKPQRATAGSAGYDFFTVKTLTLKPGQTLRIPTGLRVFIEPGWVLVLVPRSSLGFKYRLQMDNTLGVIDSDYVQSDNEGHIFVQLTNDSTTGKNLRVEAGQALFQGIFLPFGLCEDDQTVTKRNGGFGSTDTVQKEGIPPVKRVL